MVVVTNMWLSTWAIATLSLSLALSLIVLVVCCVCWQGKKKHAYTSEKSNRKSFDMPGGIGLTEIILNERDTTKFRGIGIGSNLNNNYCCKIGEPGKVKKNYSVLVAKHQHMLKVATLPDDQRMNGYGSPLLKSCNSDFADSDFRSCAGSDCSDSSKNSFYSVYPNARKGSMAETMRGALSQANLKDCEDI